MRANEHVLDNAEIPEHAPMLESPRDTERCQLLGGQPRDVASGETYAACVDGLEAGHDVKECRLAGAVRADDADEFAFCNVEADGIHGGNPTEAARQVSDLEESRHLTASRANPAAGTG